MKSNLLAFVLTIGLFACNQSQQSATDSPQFGAF